MGKAGVLGAVDPVLVPGVGAVPGLELGKLPDFGAGGEGLEPPAVGVGEGELRSGMRPFPGGRLGSGDPIGGRKERPNSGTKVVGG